MINNKSAAEMSLNVIVVAAIVLIVLVVLTIAFTTKFGEFNKQVDDCNAKGGKEMTKQECLSEGGIVMFRIYNEEGDSTKMYCCST
ncbi:MAG: hypothetical protein ACQESF_00200 [Nanobdellota archaeon]